MVTKTTQAPKGGEQTRQQKMETFLATFRLALNA